jgi:hypothetical protein
VRNADSYSAACCFASTDPTPAFLSCARTFSAICGAVSSVAGGLAGFPLPIASFASSAIVAGSDCRYSCASLSDMPSGFVRASGSSAS